MRNVLFAFFLGVFVPVVMSAVELHTLTVVKTGIGAGTVSDGAYIDCGAFCSAAYTHGSTITLTAVADLDSEFYGWSGPCSGINACVVVLEEDITVTARFGCIAGSYRLLGMTCGYNLRGDAYEECVNGWWVAGCDDPDRCVADERECEGNIFKVCEMQTSGGYDWSIITCDDGLPCTADACEPDEGCLFNAAVMGGTLCRAAAGVCDTPEYCDGFFGECPFDLKSTDLCRATSGGGCDIAEYCDGVDDHCPPDMIMGSGVLCRETAGACDAPEYCTGMSKNCPADGVADNTRICRPADGDCDVAEYCDGVNKECPADLFADATILCRPAIDPECDVAEYCSGEGPQCPEDVFVAAGTPCGDTTTDTICDKPDTCDGVGACLPNYEPTTALCRAPVDVCDAPEYCDGAGFCPLDLLQPNTEVCRPSVAYCDAAEYCTGNDVACPPENYTMINGIVCDDGFDYTQNETCHDGVCSGTEFVGSCDAPYLVSAFPFTIESTTVGRPSHITTYGLNCPLSHAPLGDAVFRVPMDSSEEYRITIVRHGGWTGFVAIIPICSALYTNATCLNANSAADSFTYSPFTSGNATLVVESNNAEGGFTLTIEKIEKPQPDEDTVIPDDGIDPTDDILPDEELPDEEEPDTAEPDEVVTDDILADEDQEESDDAPVFADDGTVVPDADTTVTDDTVIPDETVVPDTAVTNDETPDDTADEIFFDDLTPGTDTDKKKDSGCGCSLVF